MDKCKYCEQGRECICVRVDNFFNENWHLMYVWHTQAEYKFAYVIPKADKAKSKSEKAAGEKAA